jgi:hypothetical protein
VNERGDQVQRLLKALATHADLVADAFEGSVCAGDKARNQGIDALFSLNVLKPYEEDSYRLNPRLREFISDYFSSYQAFQALQLVSPIMTQAQFQWNELRRLKLAGGKSDQPRLNSALDDSIVEIAYSIEHNLGLLHSLISTQYGNVDDLTTKLAQNRYYAQQVKAFLRDVQSIDKFVEQVAEEAVAVGLPHVRQLVTRRLAARQLLWTSQIKDVQAAISKRLFEAKLMEARLKRLSRFALWLARNKTADGWDVPVSAQVSPVLVRPEKMALRPQPDVSDMADVVREGLMAAVAKLPLKVVREKSEQDFGEQVLLDDDDDAPESLGPQQIALMELSQQLAASSEPISLLTWKRHRAELAEVGDEPWLLFACLQLKGQGHRLQFLSADSAEPFSVNETFYDIEAQLGPIQATR